MKKDTKKKLILALIAVAVALVINAAISGMNKKETKEGYKEVKVTIVDKDGRTVLDRNFETDADNLTAFVKGQPDLKAKIEQGEYGSLLTSIYGLDQDMDKGPWLVFESDTNASCKEAGGYCPAMDDVVLDENDSFTFKQITSFE